MEAVGFPGYSNAVLFRMKNFHILVQYPVYILSSLYLAAHCIVHVGDRSPQAIMEKHDKR